MKDNSLYEKTKAGIKKSSFFITGMKVDSIVPRVSGSKFVILKNDDEF